MTYKDAYGGPLVTVEAWENRYYSVIGKLREMQSKMK